MSNMKALEERWPSMREHGEISPPEAVTMTVDETVPADDIEGDLIPSSPQAGLVAASEPTSQPDVVPRQHLLDPYTAMKEAEAALIDARQEHREARAATIAARATFAKALETWNHSGPIMTQEQQAREFIATSNADRAARAAAAGGAIHHPGVTRTARAMAGGNMRRGGGGAFRRGPDGVHAYSKADAMTLEARRLQAAATARVKPPSER